MKIVIQRVSSASVKNNVTGEARKIERGAVVLTGFRRGDSRDKADYMAEKISTLRIFPPESGRADFSVSAKDSGFEILLVPQFTLYGDIKKGRRPDFTTAADSDEASRLFEYFAGKLSEKVKTSCGWFGVYQEVNIVNDGPVTLVFEK